MATSPERLASFFQADVDYFATLERSWREPGSISPIEIARARRQGGLSNNAAEEALDQLLDERKTEPRMREPASTFVTYARRLAQSVTALHNQPPSPYSSDDLSQLSELRTRLDRIVQGLRSANFDSPAIRPIPSTSAKAFEQLDVLRRQVSILEDAAARLIEATVARRSPAMQQATS